MFVVQVRCSPLHLEGFDDTSQDLAADVHVASEGALLVNVAEGSGLTVMLSCGSWCSCSTGIDANLLGGLESETNALDIADLVGAKLDTQRTTGA